MTLSLSNRGGFLTGPTNNHYPESLKCCLYGALTDQYPLCYCVAAICREKEISSNLIKHGEENKQRCRQRTSQVNMHHNREVLLGWCVCLFGRVCVCVCLPVVMLSVFSMKHSLSVLNKHSSAGQLRSVLNPLFHL